MECSGSECSTTTASCSCEGMQTSKCGVSCECPSCTGQNPLDFMEIMWHKASLAAMLEVKKDRIKSKLEKAFGKALDQGADAVVDAVAKKMQAAVVTSSSEQELRGKLRSILSDAMKN